MLFVIKCIDKPDHLSVRLANREAHLAYVNDFRDQLVTAGPLLSDAEEMNGSMLVMDVADRAAAEAFCANDPYALAGLFESVSIRRWKQTLP